MNYKKEKIRWRDVRVGDVLPDGSVCTQIHSEHLDNCLRITSIDLNNQKKELTTSEDHLFLCDISDLPRRCRKRILDGCHNEIIPVMVDYIISSDGSDYLSNVEKELLYRSLEDGNFESEYLKDKDFDEIIVKDESKIYDRDLNMVWLTALEIYNIKRNYPKKMIKSGSCIIDKLEFIGEQLCFCISTSTGHYVIDSSNHLVFQKEWSGRLHKPQDLIDREVSVMPSYKRLSDEELESMTCKELLNEYEKLSAKISERNLQDKKQTNYNRIVMRQNFVDLPFTEWIKLKWRQLRRSCSWAEVARMLKNEENWWELSTGEYVEQETMAKMSAGMGLVSHNSVTIRNIIFHCLTHGITIGLVDLKLTEFQPYRGHNGVIGVANTVEEAVELLRIGRQLMRLRNKELAKAGVTDILDYKPQKKTSRIAVFGREFDEKDKLMMKDDDGNEKEITFGELEQMLYKE